ncbi:autotransporter-associated beta strand repeat-containing protein [Puniceicoccus vermicola]|uniref:Autotransporter-associated beta strand repeat-containing protein n=1 Tax=Puniceicoccus vermicola TaxID=388746 RepID=A0A7X1AZP5_9BACT|nr:autotransporter-associated beta strand repeat-containing protein [Puniceicoccus vermicola]MBC2602948.1 autotransporter-associated beta strand repeat-containing protein [Puniceicoccus vermicola]
MRLTYICLRVSLVSLFIPRSTIKAADRIFDGEAGAPYNWTDEVNWDGNTAIADGDNLSFGTLIQSISMTNDTVGLSLGSLTFNGGANAILNAVGEDNNALSFSGGIFLVSSGNTTIESSLILTADQTFSNTLANDRVLTFGPLNANAANISMGVYNLELHSTSSGAGAADIRFGFGGALTGSGDITKTGAGRATFRGDGSGFSGDIFVNEGALIAQSQLGSALGNTTGSTTVASGATLVFENNPSNGEQITVGGQGADCSAFAPNQRGAIAFTGTLTSQTTVFTLSSDTTIGFKDANRKVSLTGGIDESTGGSGLEKVGYWADPNAGFLVLTETDSTYTGTTTVKGGGLVTRQWKYAVYEDGAELLFNLERDPYEMNNLADDPDYVERKCGLRRQLRDECIRTDVGTWPFLLARMA